MSHALIRTSVKGGDFIGTCIKCGAQGLHINDSYNDCPNDSKMSDEEAIDFVSNPGDGRPPHKHN